MNYLNEEDYIKAINDNHENRAYQYLFAEYLQEKGEDNLAEGWRVLIERGKSPTYWPGVPSMPGDYRGWNWFAVEKLDQHLPSTTLLPSANLYSEITFLVKGDKGGGSKYKLNPDLKPAFPTFFGAMQAAAVAYVRRIYDENYGKEVCQTCEGMGVIVSDLPSFVPIGDCPNCNGTGFIR